MDLRFSTWRSSPGQFLSLMWCLRTQLREKTSISAAPVFPPVDWTTSKRRKRPVNDTGTMCGSRRLPAGKGPYRLRPSTTRAKVRVIAEPSDISRVTKEIPVILRCCPRSMVIKALSPSSSEAHSVERLPSTAFDARKALLHCELTAMTLAPMAMSWPGKAISRRREGGQLSGLKDAPLRVGGGEQEAVGRARGQTAEDDGVPGDRGAAHVGIVCDRSQRRRPAVGDGAHSRRVGLDLHDRRSAVGGELQVNLPDLDQAKVTNSRGVLGCGGATARSEPETECDDRGSERGRSAASRRAALSPCRIRGQNRRPACPLHRRRVFGTSM